MNKIINIVFYNYYEDGKEVREACVFYRDGSIKETTYEGGIDACEEIVKERNITSTNVFKEMINKDIVHVVTKEDFISNFDSYVNHELIDEEMIDNVISDELAKVKTKKPNEVQTENKMENKKMSKEEYSKLPDYLKPAANIDLSESDDYEDEDDYEDNFFEDNAEVTYTDEDNNDDDDYDEEDALVGDENQTRPTIFNRFEASRADDDDDDDQDYDEDEDEDEDDLVIESAAANNFSYDEDHNIYGTDYADDDEDEDEDEDEDNFTSGSDSNGAASDDNSVLTLDDNNHVVLSDDNNSDDFDDDFDDEFEDDFDDSFDKDIEAEELLDNTKKPKKDGFFKKQFNKLKKSSLGVKITTIGTALILALSLTGCGLNKNSKEGEMNSSNLSTSLVREIDDNVEEDLDVVVADFANKNTKTDTTTTEANNDLYDAYTYEELLGVTTNKTQKTAMTNVKTTIEGFNGDFADAYVEEGKDIRAALTFDEIVALQQAYNEYSRDEIKAIFNGAEIRADEMAQDYKSASLQLMGAYIIEDSENPVDMSYLLETEEGKEFYQKYHDMFLAAKEAEGQDKLDKIKAFYQEVEKDFPITDEVRTEGIVHADDYDQVTAYKLAVTPMIAASEMIFQNYNIDYTLDDTKIDFINDIGLCNYADDTFERVETVTLSFDEDNTNPLYEQYRAAIITELTVKGHYVIDDEHRELSKLDKFINTVNWHFDIVDVNGVETTTGETTTKTETRTETREWTETNTDVKTEIDIHEEEIPEEEKEKIDEKIEEENEEEKKQAEEEAEEERKRQQAEEDEKAKKIEEEVKEENEKVEENIDDINKKIEENNKDDDTSNDNEINEKDYEGVDFDDDHSDENGNLDPSVKDVTTDSTGYDPNEELPDPNKTGAEFDKKADTNLQTSGYNLDPTQPITHDDDTQFRIVDSGYNLDPTKPVDQGTEFRIVDSGYDLDPTQPVVHNDDTDTEDDYTEDAYAEYDENTPKYDEDGNLIGTEENIKDEYTEKYYDEYGNVYYSYEDFINAYVEYQAADTATETDAAQYTK